MRIRSLLLKDPDTAVAELNRINREDPEIQARHEWTLRRGAALTRWYYERC